MKARKKLFRSDPRVIACDLAKERAGGPTALAGKLGIKRQAVSLWVIVPAERVLQVEVLSGVSRHELRPDIFGPAPKERDEAAA
jgi:DNA-binding transcriptional regulator YdaS (Cro superfamily)